MGEKLKAKETPAQPLFPLSEKALAIAREMRASRIAFDDKMHNAWHDDLEYSHPKLAKAYTLPLAASIIEPGQSPKEIIRSFNILWSAVTAYSMVAGDAKERRIKIPPITKDDIEGQAEDVIGKIDKNGEMIKKMADVTEKLYDSGMNIDQAKNTTLQDTGVGISFFDAHSEFYQNVLDTLPSSDPHVNTYLLETYGGPQMKNIAFDEMSEKGQSEISIFLHIYALFAKKMWYPYMKPSDNSAVDN